MRGFMDMVQTYHMRLQQEPEQRDHGEPLAPAHTPPMAGMADIIGLSCRFPESAGPAEFWANLVSGKDMVSSR